ncbi:MAG TPA: ABC transporter substrate-binding protein [Chloroflexota bacterium]|nr:ABC transporter substrate-binding protein [Chloroflexota bacterium]
MARRLSLALALASLIALVAAHPAHAHATAGPRAASTSLRTVTIGMGYIPSVQFAPFYVADQRGYYRRAGLKVTFDYASSPNLLQLVGAGRVDLAIADGTDAIAAVAQGVPIVYVMAEYQRFPVAIFSLAGSHIRSVADLRGKTIGVPGRYGATYVGLLAALHAAGLRPADVKIQTIGYTQVESVATRKVDAAIGYSPNEPVLLARRGYKVNTIEVSAVANLVGPGVVAGRSLIAHDPALVRAFVQATLHGMADAIANPHMAFTMALRVPGLTTLRGRDATDQYAVLLRTIAFWHSPSTRAHGLGYADPMQWRTSVRILHAIGQLPHMPEPATLYANRFVTGSAKR